MEILYLIGNGFDINAGLHTKSSGIIKAYKESLDSRIKQTSLKQGIRMLHDAMDEDDKKGNFYRKWSSFEKTLGEFTDCLESADDPVRCFNEAFDDSRDFIGDAIKKENERAESIDFNHEMLQAFWNGAVSCLEDKLVPRDRRQLETCLAHDHNRAIRFLTFNYTCLLDRLIGAANKDENIDKTVVINNSRYSRQLFDPIHVHGSLDDSSGILIGVDNASQIAGKTCAASDIVLNKFVKPTLNNRVGMLRDENAFGLIDRADVVCIYGMSIGETDSTWWKRVADHVANPNASCMLVIGQRRPKGTSPYAPESLPDRTDEIKERFCEVAGLGEDSRDLLSSRTVVSFGSEAFSMDLGFPDEGTDGLQAS
jgi:hypothetical protein